MRSYRNLLLTILSLILLSANTISNDVSEFDEIPDVQAVTEEIPTQQQQKVTTEDHHVRIQFCTS